MNQICIRVRFNSKPGSYSKYSNHRVSTLTYVVYLGPLPMTKQCNQKSGNDQLQARN